MRPGNHPATSRSPRPAYASTAASAWTGTTCGCSARRSGGTRDWPTSTPRMWRADAPGTAGALASPAGASVRFSGGYRGRGHWQYVRHRCTAQSFTDGLGDGQAGRHAFGIARRAASSMEVFDGQRNRGSALQQDVTDEPATQPGKHSKGAKPDGIQLSRRATTPPSIAFANTPVKSKARNKSVTGTSVTVACTSSAAGQRASLTVRDRKPQHGREPASFSHGAEYTDASPTTATNLATSGVLRLRPAPLPVPGPRRRRGAGLGRLRRPTAPPPSRGPTNRIHPLPRTLHRRQRRTSRRRPVPGRGACRRPVSAVRTEGGRGRGQLTRRSR